MRKIVLWSRAIITPDPRDVFFLIVADLDAGLFCVEGPMSDDAPWHLAVDRARQQHNRHVLCGPTGPDHEALASEFQRTHGFAAFRRQHREATRMSEQLPAVVQSGALAVSANTYIVPAIVAALDVQASWRYVEYFAANIRSPNTRRAYARACSRYFGWCEDRGLILTTIRPFDVGEWIEQLQENHGAAGVKQQLAAVRKMFNWLITGQIAPVNPAAAVRGQKLAVKTDKTPMRDGKEWHKLIDGIPSADCSQSARPRTDSHPHLLFRPHHGSAAHEGGRSPVQGRRLANSVHETGGKEHCMPCHHALAEALRAYIDAVGIAEDRKGWLYRTSHRHSAMVLTEQPMAQADALAHDPRPCQSRRHRSANRQSHVPRSRYHRLSRQWRRARARAVNGRA